MSRSWELLYFDSNKSAQTHNQSWETISYVKIFPTWRDYNFIRELLFFDSNKSCFSVGNDKCENWVY